MTGSKQMLLFKDGNFNNLPEDCILTDISSFVPVVSMFFHFAELKIYLCSSNFFIPLRNFIFLILFQKFLSTFVYANKNNFMQDE